jgi:copper homeostasis protein
MILEVIATSVTDAILAEQGGADRIELVTGIAEGGLTPSAGCIREVIRAISIPVNVMVRPHSRSFVYDAHDLRTMMTDIRFIQEAGAAGIVLGTLTQEGRIDADAMALLLRDVEGLDVTFHRAFDELQDQLEGIRVLAGFPRVRRILTSGGQSPAPEAVEQIKALVEEARKVSMRILAGHGLTLEALEGFVVETGVQEVHFGSAVRRDGQFSQQVDLQRIRTVLEILERY